MAKYFVHCERHGRIKGYYSDPGEASRARREHRRNIPGPHGRIRVIEEYTVTKYGVDLINLRIYKRNR